MAINVAEPTSYVHGRLDKILERIRLSKAWGKASLELQFTNGQLQLVGEHFEESVKLQTADKQKN